MASIMAMVCSATATAFAPGVFITAMPCRVAASRSMLSTPTPARPITRSLRAFASSGPSTCTAERTIKASADSSCPDSVPSICSGVTTVHRGSRSKSTADGEIFSATTTFILNSPFTPSQLCSTHKFIGWMTYSEPLQENDSPLTCLNFSLPRFLSPYEHIFRWECIVNIKTVFLVLLTVFAMGCYGSKYNPMTGTGAPTIQALVPSSMPAGSPAFTLTVKGNRLRIELRRLLGCPRYAPYHHLRDGRKSANGANHGR